LFEEVVFIPYLSQFINTIFSRKKEDFPRAGAERPPRGYHTERNPCFFLT